MSVGGRVDAAGGPMPPLARRLSELVEETRDEIQSGYIDGGRDGIDAREAVELPGFGERYDGSESEGTVPCGEPLPHYCTDCGRVTGVGATCRRSQCPRCSVKWCMLRAERNLAKLDTVARVMYRDRGGETPIFKHHVVVDPPPGWTIRTVEDIRETRRLVADMMREWGGEGVVIPHLYRGDTGEGIDDLGAWKDRLPPFDGEPPDWDEARDDLSWEPHFHVVCAAPQGSIPGEGTVEPFQDRTGWVIHRIHDEAGRSIKDLHAAARVLTYCFSHVGIDASGESYRSLHEAYGRLWRSGDVDVMESVEEEAKDAVASAAPRTLGLPISDVQCTRTRDPSESAGGVNVRRTYASGSSSEIDATAPADPTPADDLDATPNEGSVGGEADAEDRQCRGRIEHISNAPDQLEDDEWREAAPYATELGEMYAAWDRDEWEVGDQIPPPG